MSTVAPPRVRPGFVAPSPVRWVHVFADLERAGLCLAEVARRVDIPKETLREWKGGRQPLHPAGAVVLAFYDWVVTKDSRQDGSGYRWK